MLLSYKPLGDRIVRPKRASTATSASPPFRVPSTIPAQTQLSNEIFSSPHKTATKLVYMPPSLDGDRLMGRTPTHHSHGGRASPMPQAILSHAIIVEAITQSPDQGSTLDFSHRNIVDVGEMGAQELAKVGRGENLVDESSVLRIALVGNRLATLPMGFALLSRLRYLTLRSNSFSVFPEVLTIMPSLEILDFSRNKIKRLPSNPGSLVNLRVLSLSRNKLQRLPAYFASFSSLSVLKTSHNPIEWPPRVVMEPTDDLDDPEAMQRWLSSVKRWLAENSHIDAPSGEARRPSESPSLSRSESSQTDLGSVDDSYASWSRYYDHNADPGLTPHARSFSIDSQVSTYSTSSSIAPVEPSKPSKPPPLHLGFLPQSLPSSLTASPDAYLPTPEDSLTTADDDAARAMYDVQQGKDKQHGRNASYAHEGPWSSRNAALAPKKSLPDLRDAAMDFPSQKTVTARPRAPDIPLRSNPHDDVHTPTPSTSQKPKPPSTTGLRETQPLRIRASSRSTRTEPSPPAQSRERPAPSMDVERNSYFRRLSTMPSSSVAAVIPKALLTLVDSVRGILFAVSQVYQTLQHYTVYAIDERLSSVLLKVLDPASRYMTQLITALDRFDTMSRRSFPTPAVCRSVVESCRDNVAVFGKAVGVLALQLKVLATRDDVRYTRQMLLVLYGAMAEISNSWHAMVPHLEAVEPLLRDIRSRPPPLSKSSHASSSRVAIPPIAEHPEQSTASAPPIPSASSRLPVPPPIQRAQSARPSLTTSTSPAINRAHSAQPLVVASSLPKEPRTRMNRRHAGSFSVKDLQIGKALPSNSEMMSPTGGVVSGTASTIPTPRSIARHAAPPPLPAGPIPPVPAFHSNHHPPISVTTPSPGLQSHLRQDSQTLPVPSPVPSPPYIARSHHLEVPSNSNTLVDKEAIEAMNGAVRAAPAVWSMLEEILNDMPDATVDQRESLVKAQAVTRKLRENIKAVHEDHHAANRKALREDAHVFVKTVIQLSNVVKTYGSAHRLSAQLRKDIAKLTNATQEFVMLLHVSSFSPGHASRPYSPMHQGSGLSAQPHTQGAVSHQIGSEAKLGVPGAGTGGASLSRSRSAQPAASSRFAPTVAKDVPRSALPHQTFKISPAPRHIGSRLKISEDALEGLG